MYVSCFSLYIYNTRVCVCVSVGPLLGVRVPVSATQQQGQARAWRKARSSPTALECGDTVRL